MKLLDSKRRAVFAIGLVLMLLTGAWGSYAAAAPDGPPSPPSGSGSPDPALQQHALTYAPGPLDNPLKGFLPFFFSKTDYATGYPHSMEWSYFALNEVMTNANNCGYYDWSMIEQALDEIASRGKHAAIRLYMEYPGGTGSHPANGIPACLNGDVAMRSNTFWGTTSPDYDDPDLIAALVEFIEAFGDKYDGDPRLGFIHMGLIGLWGEWHTWPFDRDLTDGYPNLFPTDATVNTIIDAYDDSFDETRLVIRYPDLGAGHAAQANIGFADDSWPYKEFRSGATEPKSMTLPVSMGGWSDAFLQLALNVGGENKWIDEVIGGEARPEIQGSMFSNWPTGGGQVSHLKDSIELTHISWMINQQGITGYSASDPKVAEAVRLMGYEYHVNNAYYNNVSAGVPLQVGVSIENRGVAPFYYQWPVKLGLKNAQGIVVQEWDTPWDLTKVHPAHIRTFPDWNTGQSYMPFADSQYYETTVGTSGVGGGTYSLVMRVVNSLENVTEASVRDNIETWQPFLPAKKFRFANAEQGADGWLDLGSVTIGSGSSDVTPPSVPANLASPSTTSSSVSLTWTPSTDNVGVTGYEVFRDGALAGTATTASFTDTGLSASTGYLYTVRAVDAAGNRSAFSSGLSVTTDADPVPGGASYEAERAGNTLSGGAAIASCGSCSGGSKVGYVGNGGELQFNGVNVSSAGTYSLTIAYLTAEARSAQLRVNGGTPVALNFPSTGGWNTVGNVSVEVQLNAGDNSIRISNPNGWAPDFDKLTIASGNGNGGGNGGGNGNGGGGGLLLDNFDGTPSWPGTNDLGRWAGANGFVNHAGVLDGGALKLQYNNAGWLGTDIHQDLSNYAKMIIRMKGASGGEQQHIQLQLGGVARSLAAFSGDTVTAAYTDIEIDLAANGVNRSAPGQLQMTFWHGGTGTIWIDEIRFE